MRKLTVMSVVLLEGLIGLQGCLLVPQNRRGRLADPIMSMAPEPLEGQKRQKFYTSREGAASGDGTPAGGGCACQ